MHFKVCWVFTPISRAFAYLRHETNTAIGSPSNPCAWRANIQAVADGVRDFLDLRVLVMVCQNERAAAA